MLIMVQQETTNNIFSNPFSASSAHRLDFIHAFGYAVRAETKQQGGIVPLPPPAFDFFFLFFSYFTAPNEIFQQTANVLLQLN